MATTTTTPTTANVADNAVCLNFFEGDDRARAWYCAGEGVGALQSIRKNYEVLQRMLESAGSESTSRITTLETTLRALQSEKDQIQAALTTAQRERALMKTFLGNHAELSVAAISPVLQAITRDTQTVRLAQFDANQQALIVNAQSELSQAVYKAGLVDFLGDGEAQRSADGLIRHLVAINAAESSNLLASWNELHKNPNDTGTVSKFATLFRRVIQNWQKPTAASPPAVTTDTGLEAMSTSAVARRRRGGGQQWSRGGRGVRRQ